MSKPIPIQINIPNPCSENWEQMTIQELISNYNADRKFYLTNKYNETLLRSDFLDPLFELFGWDIKNGAGKPTN